MGLLGKRGDIFQEVHSFYLINENLKYLKTKKVYKQKDSVVTKDLNLRILTRNLVTFKRWGIRIKNGAFTEKSDF